MARDGSSGGVVRTVAIDRNGATKHVIMGESRIVCVYLYSYDIFLLLSLRILR